MFEIPFGNTICSDINHHLVTCKSRYEVCLENLDHHDPENLVGLFRLFQHSRAVVVEFQVPPSTLYSAVVPLPEVDRAI